MNLGIDFENGLGDAEGHVFERRDSPTMSAGDLPTLGFRRDAGLMGS